MKLSVRSVVSQSTWQGFNIALDMQYIQLISLSASLCVLVCVSIASVYLKYQMILLNQDLMQYQSQLQTVIALNQEMKLEESELNRYDRIRLIASKRLGLQSAQSGQFVK